MTELVPSVHTEQVLVPTAHQLAWQRQRLGMFVHFGLNTFHDKEWSNGTLPAADFAPSDLDARQWARTAKESGAEYLVLTAKHHDGFCLWPSATTRYSVASSPWRDGRGDLVAEVAEACRAEGLTLGLYLSPWDRNHPAYPDPAAYDDVYCAQLTELCTRYGPLGELWFDGAGSEGRVYDWARISAVAAEHQPQAMVFNMGAPTIRWAGNEDGIVTDPVDYVVTHTQMSQYTVVTTRFEHALYLPPECNVSLHRGWFWHTAAERKTVEHLMAVWYRSVGRGANLLLNVPPDRSGRIAAEDVARLREWTAHRERLFAEPVEGDVAGDEVSFPPGTMIDHVELREDLTAGQRIRGFTVLHGDTVIASGPTVGAQRLVVLDPVRVDRLRVVLDGGRLTGVTAWHTGSSVIPDLPEGYRAPTDYPED